jgi:hypothetical protein
LIGEPLTELDEELAAFVVLGWLKPTLVTISEWTPVGPE